MAANKKVVLPYGFCQKLKCDLRCDAQQFVLTDPHAMSALCEQLGKDGTTNLVISDCVRSETIKVRSFCGELRINRGQCGSKPLSWCAGADVQFFLTPELTMAAIAETQAEEGAEGGVIIKSDNYDVKRDEENPSCWIIEPKEKEPCEFCVPGYDIKIDKYGVTTVSENAGTRIKDGKYTNPTICYENGKQISIESGSPVVGAACGCNTCCNKTDSVVDG